MEEAGWRGIAAKAGRADRGRRRALCHTTPRAKRGLGRRLWSEGPGAAQWGGEGYGEVWHPSQPHGLD